MDPATSFAIEPIFVSIKPPNIFSRSSSSSSVTSLLTSSDNFFKSFNVLAVCLSLISSFETSFSFPIVSKTSFNS